MERGVTMDWIFEHKTDLLLAVTSLVTVASIIAKLTPAEWDDKLVGKILKLLSLNK
jgi:hypothetical protein